MSQTTLGTPIHHDGVMISDKRAAAEKRGSVGIDPRAQITALAWTPWALSLQAAWLAGRRDLARCQAAVTNSRQRGPLRQVFVSAESERSTMTPWVRRSSINARRWRER